MFVFVFLIEKVDPYRFGAGGGGGCAPRATPSYVYIIIMCIFEESMSILSVIAMLPTMSV